VIVRFLSSVVLVLAAAAPSQPADMPRPEHPRPDAVRTHWLNLNGTWDFRFDPHDEGLEAGWFRPGAEGFDRKIVVPFPWESELSGIHDTSGKSQIGWYRRSFRVPDDFPKDQRVWLRFEAVDWRADVWLNGRRVGEHEGGYTPFELDATPLLLTHGAENVLVVRAYDPTDPSLPTGKQVGWYTTTSGIWQTVWLEARPRVDLRGFTVRTTIEPPQAEIAVEVAGAVPDGWMAEVHSDDPAIGLVSAPVEPRANGSAGGGRATIVVPVRDPMLWTPETPHLYDITLKLKDSDGQPIDTVQTYFGLRTISRGKLPGEDFERILLNGKPIYLRGALDQSFNPKGIYTAPSDAFLKNDIAFAKQCGLNFLRIHIKPDEPRRLYWADRLGMLIMEDMPNTWRQNARAREAWEKTLREVVARDRNHPAIFAWVDFNETWGLGRPEDYKASTDTQDWVKRMVALTRQLDPTRLVEDNSPCNYDHVSGTDLNSWHFYIDDHDEAKRHIEEVVERSTPGSTFNYCPGERMNSAPLINSEYGAVSAGGGDRDISWGFRDLTTLLRKHNKIQGYIYTELTDIEWEHNGYANYDRSPKVYGYDAFVPGMTVADLNGADFVGQDAPPAIVVKPGETIRVPVFVSHYSDRADPPKLRWWVTGHDYGGLKVELEPEERAVEWKRYEVTPQSKPLAFRLNAPFVGAVGFELIDPAGKRIAANFVNVVVRPETPLPRIERLGDHAVALRFRPGDFWQARWSGPKGTPTGKVHGQGTGSFAYRLRLPAVVVKAKPTQIALRIEAAAKAGREKVDWPERVNAQDYPQTDARTWPTTLEVAVNGARLARLELADDPADARGVLSHLNRVERGSFGERVTIDSALPGTAKADLAAGRPLTLRLSVPEDAERRGGLAIFGADAGAYPFDPLIVIRTEDALPDDLGVDPDAPVAVDVAAARMTSVLRAGDSNQGAPTEWAYTTTDPGPGWEAPDFDDRDWKRGPGGFGTPGTPALQERTIWDTSTIWLRATVELPELGQGDALNLHLFHDEDVEIHVNGRRLVRERGYVTSYLDRPLNESQKALFRPGKNTIAVVCRQTGGGQGIDIGLSLLRDE
jgi:hypothetical protein